MAANIGLLSIALFVIFAKRTDTFQGGFMDDIHCWIRWAWANKENGIGYIYNTDSNYLPFYRYILWAFASLFDSREQIEAGIGYLKYITLAFEIGGLYLLYRWIDKRIPFFVILLISFLNLTFLYNNMIWGQVDGILASFAFALIYFTYNRKLIAATMCLVLMMNFKLQGIIFVPIFILLLLNLYRGKDLLRGIASIIIIGLVMQLLILIPFLMKDGGVAQLWQMLNTLVGYVPKISSLAYNFWSLLYGATSDIMPDSDVFVLGLSYKQFGLLTFCLVSLLAMMPLMRNAWRFQLGKDESVSLISKPRLSLIVAIVAMSFFYFNTQMHERYIFPAFIFISAYAFAQKDFIPYVLFSIAHFLNMEFVLRWAKFENYEGNWLFDRFAIASIFGFVLLYLFYRLYAPASKFLLPKSKL